MYGEWIDNNNKDIPGVHSVQLRSEDVYIFGYQDDPYFKMVGIRADGTHVDGRYTDATVGASDSSIIIAWETATQKGVGATQYNVKNVEAIDEGATVLSEGSGSGPLTKAVCFVMYGLAIDVWRPITVSDQYH